MAVSTIFVGPGRNPDAERLLSSDWKKTLQKIFWFKFEGLILILLHKRRMLARSEGTLERLML
jgi:hypothetical protein